MCDKGCVVGVVLVRILVRRIRRNVVVVVVEVEMAREEKKGVDMWCGSGFEQDGKGGDKVRGRGQEGSCGGKRGWGRGGHGALLWRGCGEGKGWERVLGGWWLLGLGVGVSTVVRSVGVNEGFFLFRSCLINGKLRNVSIFGKRGGREKFPAIGASASNEDKRRSFCFVGWFFSGLPMYITFKLMALLGNSRCIYM